ncbi:hypothetical protein KUCAC02_030499 [Chaenocephalus aceratus]|uniref:Uncharacterized protein n=1 Tax=Chaenocephalus aceratus TaxID=36190 RepID=A0ACB9XKA5_CHAAC|nr:hypothetical protein KUCAC02_030499 [Chaenocephalus aceratus]
MIPFSKAKVILSNRRKGLVLKVQTKEGGGRWGCCYNDTSQDLTERSHCRAACQALSFIYPFSSHQTD